MGKITYEEKPYFCEQFFKGTYNKKPFTLIDRNDEVYVNFDSHYECETHEFDAILQNIINQYKTNKNGTTKTRKK